MIKVEYKLVSATEAFSNKYPDYENWTGEDEEACKDSYRTAIYRFENGVAVEYLGSDGGEPEDQSLSRDWSWVDTALDKAYKLGLEHGKNRCDQPV